MSTFEIKLPQFEGPFDLLLFFIERDELDIYDIPIAKITDDFLSYIHHLEQMDIELASEFMLVAATLMRIKVKMLLPRKEVDATGKDLDPREELVQKLIEYKKFKTVTQEFAELEENRHMKFKRGHVLVDIKAVAESNQKDAELNNLTLFNMLNTFREVLKRFETEQVKIQHTVVKYAYTIEDQKKHLLKTLSKKKPTPFIDIFNHCENRIHALFIFLALLELIQLEKVDVEVGEGFNNFEMKLTDVKPAA